MPNGDPRDGFFYLTLTLMIDSYNPQVAQLQMKVYRALSQETLGGAYAQEALSRLDSDLLDITKVSMLLYKLPLLLTALLRVA